MTEAVDQTELVSGPEAREQANNIVDRAAQGAHSVIDRAAETAGPAVERLRDGAHTIAETQDRWLAGCRESIRSHPISSVTVAAAAGVLLSRLLAR